ncbi:MAG: endolytic transglycosylase MltG [Deltaproteobacteria bacterium]|nr:endolytic transglycosylase MltG [Deltaproteobacteria bacterium]
MRKTGLIVLVSLAALLLLGAGIGWLLVSSWASSPKAGSGEPVAVDIPRGSGPLATAQLLADRGVLDDPQAFYRWLRYVERAAGKLKAGELAFRDDMSPREVLAVLLDGTPVTHKITVPEGMRIDEVAALFEQAGLADAAELERRARDPALARRLGVPHDSLEGFLHPETYSFRKHTPVEEILRAMVAGYKAVFTDAWRRQAARLQMSELEVVTLASIVEKETGVAKERSLIAGVFHNRLKKGWKLQTDPTVIYAEILTQGRFDGTIHKSDLERDHPYNTYRHAGLPPGPICNPGAAAIEAALYPQKTDNMFFVSRNDGTHEFCPTLACHNRAVQKYQR